jgi:RNA polymerase sigma-70 factor (ECF subfamily)
VADAEVLFEEHRRGVFRYLSRIVGAADAAHDLTQEVFLRVVRSDVPGPEPAVRKAWVFRIARNLALNHLRDTRRRPQATESGDQASPANQELAAAIGQAIAALPEGDRDVFLLRETAGLSYAEIAGACDLSEDAVRSRLHRARQQLRQALAGPLETHRPRGVRLAPRSRLENADE